MTQSPDGSSMSSGSMMRPAPMLPYAIQAHESSQLGSDLFGPRSCPAIGLDLFPIWNMSQSQVLVEAVIAEVSLRPGQGAGRADGVSGSESAGVCINQFHRGGKVSLVTAAAAGGFVLDGSVIHAAVIE